MDLSELQALRIQELSELAKTLNIDNDISGLNKQELTLKILEAQAKKEDKLGIRASDTHTLLFNDVKVPKKNRIGVDGFFPYENENEEFFLWKFISAKSILFISVPFDVRSLFHEE